MSRRWLALPVFVVCNVQVLQWQPDGREAISATNHTGTVTQTQLALMFFLPTTLAFTSLLLTHSFKQPPVTHQPLCLQRQLLLGCRQHCQHLTLPSHGSKLQAVSVLQQHMVQDAASRL